MRRKLARVIESLVDAGATGIVVSLSGAFANAVQEKKVREIMARKYPAHYLGSADLFLGSEVAAASDDRSRTHTAVVNAYLHRDINRHAGGAEDAVHDAGFRPPLLIAHGTGAKATQVHTKALDVYASSTARAGLGCAVVAKALYGVADFIYMDAGAGASVRVGAVVGGKASIMRGNCYQWRTGEYLDRGLKIGRRRRGRNRPGRAGRRQSRSRP